MRFLWTLPLVPRPDPSFVALMGVTLATYLVFQGLPIALLGQSVSALQLALAVFLFTSVARNLILNGRIWADTTGRVAGTVAAGLMLITLYWIIGAASPLTLKLAFSAYMLAYAVYTLGLVKWDPGGVRMIPTIWSKDPRFALTTTSLVAVGDAVFAVKLAGIAYAGSELLWVGVMTLGAIATKFFVNWINVFVVIVLLDDQD